MNTELTNEELAVYNGEMEHITKKYKEFCYSNILNKNDALLLCLGVLGFDLLKLSKDENGDIVSVIAGVNKNKKFHVKPEGREVTIYQDNDIVKIHERDVEVFLRTIAGVAYDMRGEEKKGD